MPSDGKYGLLSDRGIRLEMVERDAFHRGMRMPSDDQYGLPYDRGFCLERLERDAFDRCMKMSLDGEYRFLQASFMDIFDNFGQYFGANKSRLILLVVKQRGERIK